MDTPKSLGELLCKLTRLQGVYEVFTKTFCELPKPQHVQVEVTKILVKHYLNLFLLSLFLINSSLIFPYRCLIDIDLFLKSRFMWY